MGAVACREVCGGIHAPVENEAFPMAVLDVLLDSPLRYFKHAQAARTKVKKLQLRAVYPSHLPIDTDAPRRVSEWNMNLK